MEGYSRYSEADSDIVRGRIQHVVWDDSDSVLEKCAAGRVVLIVTVYWGIVQQVQWC